MIKASRFTSPVKRHGGKQPLARRLTRLFPAHVVYCEPYFGGGSCFFAKGAVATEVVSDIDPELMTFWMTLAADDGRVFRNYIRNNVSYSEDTFEWARGSFCRGGEAAVDLARAVRFLVLNRMSRGALGSDYAWSDRLRRGMAEQLASWDTMCGNLDVAYNRLKGRVVACGDALVVLRTADSPETLAYLDPPYPAETRTATDTYDYEMSHGDHERLVKFLACDLQGRAVVSSYPNALYDQWLGGAGWDHLEWPRKNSAGQGKVKQGRVEVVWANFDLGRWRRP